ncbi:MAG: hypothetical protein NTV56_00975 [Alphaproteobacteria bacterium]|nr:hypothetical protein [Alphaproteobacteria bacterium]
MTKFDLSRTPHDQDATDDFNKIVACIERLARRRKAKIEIEGPLLKSKVAWKIATYQQAVLYRVIALGEGTRLAWNAGNVLTALLTVRALTETIAIFDEFEVALMKRLAGEDLGAIDALIMNRSFATLDEELLKGHPEIEAERVMKFIDKLGKRYQIPIRNHYDSMSERCHPNSAGHHQMFSKTDHTTGTVTFSDLRTESMYLHFIRAPLGLLSLFEKTMNALDDAIPKIAEVHHRIKPSRLV